MGSGPGAGSRSVPDVVRNKAIAAGARDWLESLPALVDALEREWSMRVGRPYAGGTEAFVAEATLGDGSEAVLKLLVPRDAGAARHEITVLRLAAGDGCVRLLREDASRGALLLERLGPSLRELALPRAREDEILCAAARRVWRPVPGCGLPSGAEKGRWLADFVAATWEELGRPCSERAVEHALSCAARRIAAHRGERALLVHGDLHAWNALRAEDGFKLIDPDGLLAEPEYDLGVLIREDPAELLRGDPQARARRLARLTGSASSRRGARCSPPRSGRASARSPARHARPARVQSQPGVGPLGLGRSRRMPRLPGGGGRSTAGHRD
jgi:streptomycin 6-kinase